MKSLSSFFLCTLWVFVTIISYSVAMAYGFSLIQESRTTWDEYFLRALFIGGLLSGLGQWVLLETRIKGTWLWIVINILGVPVGSILGYYLYPSFDFLALAITRQGSSFSDWTDNAYPLVVISVAGMVLGLLQWLVLKNKVRFAYWWIPVSVLSWSVGLYLASKMFELLNPATWNYNWSASGAIFGAVLGGVVGVMGSIILGKMLANPIQLKKQVEVGLTNNAS